MAHARQHLRNTVIPHPRATVPFSKPSIGPAEIAEVVATLESGWLSTGPRVAAFEQAFADYVGARYALAVNSCTAALHLSLIATGIGPGDEVITTPLTFCATANVVLHAGATPVFADIDPLSHNLDPAAVSAAITPRTRVLMPVHYAGFPADMQAFQRIESAIDDGVEGVEDEGRIRDLAYLSMARSCSTPRAEPAFPVSCRASSGRSSSSA